MRLYLVASKPTDSVIFGFLPAAASARSGRDPAHRPARESTSRPSRARGCCRARAARPATEPPRRGRRTRSGSWTCDVWDARQLICAIAALPRPDAIFSNSDHLQAQTALAAAYFGVPGKDWRSAMRAKNKSLMRRRLAETGIEHVAAIEIRPGTRHPLSGLALPGGPQAGRGGGERGRHPRPRPRRAAQSSARRSSPAGRARPCSPSSTCPAALRTLETLGDGVTPGCSADSGPVCRRSRSSSRSG